MGNCKEKNITNDPYKVMANKSDNNQQVQQQSAELKQGGITLFIQNTPLIKQEMKKEFLKKYKSTNNPKKIFFEYSNKVSDNRFNCATQNGLFNAVLTAYALHMDLQLSPDDLWLCVCNNISNYVNKNPEKYRNFFVSHEGKKELVVVLPPEHFTNFPNKNNRWDIVTDLLSKEIKKNTNGQIAELMQNSFSTSTDIEKLGGQISLMSTMKAFFEYIGIIPMCGIQNIHFKGQVEDYKLLVDKAKAIKSSYNLDKVFINYLSNVEHLFDNIYQQIKDNKADISFWNKILDEEQVYIQLGSGSSPSIKYTGWFVQLFGLYNDNKQFIYKNDIPSFVCETNVKIIDMNQGGAKFDMIFEQSFDGFELIQPNIVKPIQSICIKLKEKLDNF